MTISSIIFYILYWILLNNVVFFSTNAMYFCIKIRGLPSSFSIRLFPIPLLIHPLSSSLHSSSLLPFPLIFNTHTHTLSLSHPFHFLHWRTARFQNFPTSSHFPTTSSFFTISLSYGDYFFFFNKTDRMSWTWRFKKLSTGVGRLF